MILEIMQSSVRRPKYYAKVCAVLEKNRKIHHPLVVIWLDSNNIYIGREYFFWIMIRWLWYVFESYSVGG